MRSFLRYFLGRNLLAVIFTIMVSLNHIGFIPTIPPYYAAVFALFCVFVILNCGECYYELKSGLFLLFLPFTILLAQPDSVFQSWLRLAVYASFFVIGSPLVQSNFARKFRRDSLIIVFCICVFIGVGSFIAYFLGYSAQAERAIARGINADLYDVGRFSGIAQHSMSLGPLSGIGAMVFIYLALVKQNRWFYLGAIPCIGSVMFSASRSAFVATIAGGLFILYKNSTSKGDFVKYLVTAFVCGILTFPVWSGAMSGLAAKQASHSNDTELFDSRSEKFGYRIKEFASSPIWGVGFSAIDPHTGDGFNRKRGVIEPGSSWLAILSMTGLVGFILFCRMYKQSYDTMKTSDEQISVLLFAVFILISVHMIAEGYVFATGNPLCYYVALFIGCGYDLVFKQEES